MSGGAAPRAKIVGRPVARVHTKVGVPASKSLTNRALVVAAAAGGGTITSPLDCDDTRLLAGALTACGWEVEWRGGTVCVGARAVPADRVAVDLGNSGTGSRLLLGLLAASGGETVIDGTGRLRERPMAPLISALARLGADVEVSPGDRLPALVRGRRLPGGRLTLDPGPSSQFVSALLVAAPLMAHGLWLELEGAIPSRPYLALTRDVLAAFGGNVRADAELRSWQVSPGSLGPAELRVEGDWSAAAFFLVAAAVTGGTVDVDGVDLASSQGDRRIAEILSRAGATIEGRQGGVTCHGPISGTVTADLADAPDLFPALAVAAAAVGRGSRLTGLDHLRHKESDRLAVMAENLRRLGAGVVTDETSLTVSMPVAAHDSPVDVTAAGDHRVAMAMAVAALAAGPVRIDDADCVSKSFPGFWREWQRVTG
ncbi:MAG: 3-phosphoshikimate 1-carboxyvinyltransferase [Acidobacteria bacterium]|nr:3-phosphoshikimate 1-carboxyvinyltransferase [Acidobacteriota bacterium]